VLAALFYVGLLAVIAGVLLDVFASLLPAPVAERIGRNTEGIALALLLAAWIQFVRPRLVGREEEARATGLAALACLAVALALLASDLPSSVRTLNETFVAAALLVPYLQLHRPLRRHAPLAVSGVVLAVIVIGQPTSAVTMLAEMLAVLVLAPVGFDVVDRGILDSDAETSPRLRYSWYALLVLAPILFSLMHYGVGVSGMLAEASRYSVRVAEAFLCMLLLHLFFAVALGRTGRGGRAGRPLASADGVVHHVSVHSSRASARS